MVKEIDTINQWTLISKVRDARNVCSSPSVIRIIDWVEDQLNKGRIVAFTQKEFVADLCYFLPLRLKDESLAQLIEELCKFYAKQLTGIEGDIRDSYINKHEFIKSLEVKLWESGLWGEARKWLYGFCEEVKRHPSVKRCQKEDAMTLLVEGMKKFFLSNKKEIDKEKDCFATLEEFKKTIEQEIDYRDAEELKFFKQIVEAVRRDNPGWQILNFISIVWESEGKEAVLKLLEGMGKKK